MKQVHAQNQKSSTWMNFSWKKTCFSVAQDPQTRLGKVKAYVWKVSQSCTSAAKDEIFFIYLDTCRWGYLLGVGPAKHKSSQRQALFIFSLVPKPVKYSPTPPRHLHIPAYVGVRLSTLCPIPSPTTVPLSFTSSSPQPSTSWIPTSTGTNNLYKVRRCC